VENDYLKTTTQFCTCDITNLYTMLPQEESMDIFSEFLLQFGYRKMKGIPIVFTIHRVFTIGCCCQNNQYHLLLLVIILHEGLVK
jgi:hypothetical protein